MLLSFFWLEEAELLELMCLACTNYKQILLESEKETRNAFTFIL